MTLRYAHLAPGHQREAAERLTTFGRGQRLRTVVQDGVTTGELSVPAQAARRRKNVHNMPAAAPADAASGQKRTATLAAMAVSGGRQV